MISVPEWMVVGLLGVLVMIAGWAARRMVKAYDTLREDVCEIKRQMMTMNGRIAKSERWQEERS